VVDYATLEFVANCLDWIHELKEDPRPFSRLVRMDQKRLIRGVLRDLTNQLLDGISSEGNHNGWRVQKRFLHALYGRRYEKAYQLLPALGILIDTPFYGDCPEAERILPAE
jgi:hypothetical protein